MALSQGIEPCTRGVSNHRSTGELTQHKMEEDVRIELTHAFQRGTVFKTAEPHGPQSSIGGASMT